VVARATGAADELDDEELRSGALVLERKLRRYRPRTIAFLGIGAYRMAFARPSTVLGRQIETLAATAIWVLPNPSGLNAHYQVDGLARLFRRLRAASARRAGAPGAERGARSAP